MVPKAGCPPPALLCHCKDLMKPSAYLCNWSSNKSIKYHPIKVNSQCQVCWFKHFGAPGTLDVIGYDFKGQACSLLKASDGSPGVSIEHCLSFVCYLITW